MTKIQAGSSFEDDAGVVIYGNASGVFSRLGLDVNVVKMASGSADQNGGDAQTLKLLEIPTATIVAALATGRVKNIGEPNAAVAKRYVITAWFATRDYAQRNAGVIRRFRSGLRRPTSSRSSRWRQSIITSRNRSRLRRSSLTAERTLLENVGLEDVHAALAVDEIEQSAIVERHVV